MAPSMLDQGYGNMTEETSRLEMGKSRQQEQGGGIWTIHRDATVAGTEPQAQHGLWGGEKAEQCRVREKTIQGHLFGKRQMSKVSK